ncbi:MAG: hypothetical protein KGL53_12855 [Elusimicrobia bacterium]|nr:hypothetical protein [Elusimicrobiota bacterium]
MKTAVSLPQDTFRRAERLRRRRRLSRSALYARALETFMRASEVREREAVHAAGYQAAPESAAEAESLTRASVQALADWEW